MLQIGTDLLQRGNAVAGVMLGGRADSSVVSDLTGYSAKGRVRGSAVGVYGTWMQEADGTRARMWMQPCSTAASITACRASAWRRRPTRAWPLRHWSPATFNVAGHRQRTVCAATTAAEPCRFPRRSPRGEQRYGGRPCRRRWLSGRLGVRVFGHGTAATPCSRTWA